MHKSRLHIITLFTFFLLITIQYSFAQEIQFTAATKSFVTVGEQFRVMFSVNAKATTLKPPAMEGFTVLMGPSTSTSSNIQVINGQVTQSVNYSYTFVLQATKEGKYTFDPAEIIVDGKTYKSNAITIEVVKGNPNNNQQGNQNQTNNNGTVSNDDIFVRINLNKTNVTQGEQIVATILIYTRMNLVGFEDMKFPSFKGFWSDDLENPTQVNLKQEKYNGTIYQVGVLKKTLLTPQHAGDIVIDPYELTCVVQQKVNRSRQSFFDDFFGSYQNIKKKLVSPAVTVHVKGLPGNKPAGFSGAVGSFKLEATLDNKNPKTNEAISYSLKLSGNGNLKLAEVPKINFPSDFEQYDPKTTNNVSPSAAGTSGSKIINYLLIPRHPGEYKIPSVNFSYYDLTSQSYKTLETPEFTVNVDKDTSASSQSAIVSEFTKEDVKFLGSDIHYIKPVINDLKEKNKYLISEPTFYLSYPFAMGLFIFLIIWRRKQIKQNADIAATKNRKANSVAKKRLILASKYLKENNKDLFYEELSRALWGYISDKLIIPVAELSKDKANEELQKKNISAETISQINEIIDNCEFARYSPVSDNTHMNDIYNNATELIGKLEQNLR